jgi:hypothetical protein
MIPSVNIFNEPITEKKYADKTYRINTRINEISGYAEDLEALEQAIYLILSTERYEYIIYSWDYGIELIDLYGKPMPYVMSELPRRVTEALMRDDRVEKVTDFEFEKKGNVLLVSFKVMSKIGSISTSLEVSV